MGIIYVLHFLKFQNIKQLCNLSKNLILTRDIMQEILLKYFSLQIIKLSSGYKSLQLLYKQTIYKIAK